MSRHSPSAKSKRSTTRCLECRGLLWAYDSLYANANNSKGLYRLRDTDGDDRFDEIKLLKATRGDVGHGRNDLALGPDGMIYSIHGDDVRLPDDYDPAGSPLRNYFEARLLPCSWDRQMFNAAMRLPGGYVARTDRDGQRWEVMAGGMRNPFGIAFGPSGELFTYDADMEWDAGLPWYRPTRISASGFGCRFRLANGDGALAIVVSRQFAAGAGHRSWFADCRAVWNRQPVSRALSAGDVRLRLGIRPDSGGPLGGERGQLFGDRRTVFERPAAERHRCRIRARRSDVFSDRRTQEPSRGCIASHLSASRQTRNKQHPPSSRRPPRCASGSSRCTRAAARRRSRRSGRTWPATIPSCGMRPELPWSCGRWRCGAMPLWRSSDPTAASTALLALARLGSADEQAAILKRLAELPWDTLSAEQRVTALRAWSLALARFERLPDDHLAPLARLLDDRYPDATPTVNELACELLVYLRSPQVVSKTLALLEAAKTQEEKLQYLFLLRAGGPLDVGRAESLFRVATAGRAFLRRKEMPRFLAMLKADAVAALSEAEKSALAQLLVDEPPATETFAPLAGRAFVRDWKLDDLLGSLDQIGKGAGFGRGQAGLRGRIVHPLPPIRKRWRPVGPDLTSVARRFGRVDILLSILAPSRVIDDKYRVLTITTQGGQVLSGQISGDDGLAVTLLPDLLAADKTVRVAKSQIESLSRSGVSPMPAGLLNSFSKDEVLDLLAYLESAAQAGVAGSQATATPAAAPANPQPAK